MTRTLLRALLVMLAALSLGVGSAAAQGGHYRFTGGTAAEQAQVTSALKVSAFPWSVVPQQIVINIAPGIASEATPGQIWLDSNLLDMGSFANGVVQHEYAHQVDFLLLDAAQRATLLSALGGKQWCWGDGPQIDHAQYGCERFASTLAWSYWPSADNSLQPTGPGQESSALPAKEFKALLGQLLRPGAATTLTSIVAPALAPALHGVKTAAKASTPAKGL